MKRMSGTPGMSASSEIRAGARIGGTLRKDRVGVKAADEYDTYVGGRVRIRRMTLGISQEQLAAALGLTFQQIQKYEKGQNRIGAGRLFRISQILSVPVAFFYEGLAETVVEADSEIAQRSASLQSFMTSPDGYELSVAFQNIGDMTTRRRIIDLVRTIGSDTA